VNLSEVRDFAREIALSRITPWEECASGVWLKRDDTFEVAGVRGGKVRTCLALAEAALERGAEGLVTAGSRQSPQVNIVAQIGRALRVPVRAYVPFGRPGSELELAALAGARLIPTRPGYNGVLAARARQDADLSGYGLIPFGMECAEAVEATRQQARDLPPEVDRLVVPVGSAMSLAGILWGLLDGDRRVPVLGVCVGADPERRLDLWAPPLWRALVELAPARLPYAAAAPDASYFGVDLDPHYEAKCVPELRFGDGFWLVGIRGVHSNREEVAT